MPSYKIYSDTWINAQEAISDTFTAPSDEQLNNLREDSIVKISNGRERFFVKITRITKTYIIGIVSNELVCGSEYNVGDYVSFNIYNIFKIQDDASRMNAIMDLMPLIFNMKNEGYSNEEIYAYITELNMRNISPDINI